MSEIKLPQPSSAPVVDIQLGKTTYKLLMGFRAYHQINVNPFKKDQIVAYFESLDPVTAAAMLHAGIANASSVLEIEQTITQDQVLDKLDMTTFNAALKAINTAIGAKNAEQEEGEKSPTTAPTGLKSGRSDVQ